MFFFLNVLKMNEAYSIYAVWVDNTICCIKLSPNSKLRVNGLEYTVVFAVSFDCFVNVNNPLDQYSFLFSMNSTVFSHSDTEFTSMGVC